MLFTALIFTGRTVYGALQRSRSKTTASPWLPWNLPASSASAAICVAPSKPASYLSEARSGGKGPTQLLPPDLMAMKNDSLKICMVTAYDFPSSCIAHGVGAAGAAMDVLLVGDSLGQVMLGQSSTVKVTVDDVVHHCKAVTAAASHPHATRRPLVVADMPFGSYRTPERALDTAVRLVQEGGCTAVKLEGGCSQANTIRSLVQQGLPVMGHIGLLPQVASSMGGMKVQGRSSAAACQLLNDALAVQEAGAFAIVLEMVPRELATLISQSLRIPTIGIGAGAGTDGQVLVWHDALGLNPSTPPRFVQQFAAGAEELSAGLAAFREAVRGGTFPSPAHSSRMAPTAIANLGKALEKRADVSTISRKARELADAAKESEVHGAAAWARVHVPPPPDGFERKPMEVSVDNSSAAKPHEGLRVAVIGAGAMGRLWATSLAPHARVTLCPVQDVSRDCILQHGRLRVSRLLPAQRSLSVGASVQVSSLGAVRSADVLLLAVKGAYTHAALSELWEGLRSKPSADAPLLVSLQNGVEHLELMRAWSGEGGPVGALCTTHGAYRVQLQGGELGVVHAGYGRMWGGMLSRREHPAWGAFIAALGRAQLLDRSQGSLEPGTIQLALAKKFAVNCALNPLTVILGAKNGAVTDVPAPVHELLDQAAWEAFQAVAQSGVLGPLTDAHLIGPDGLLSSPEGAFRAVGGWDTVQATAANISSMLADAQAGKALELPSLNGWVVRQLGDKAEANRMLLEAARVAALLQG